MKKINKTLLIFVSFAILLTNCTKEDITISTDEEFWLKYNQTAIIQNGELEIKFNDVIKDTRCPVDFNCMNGTVIVELLLNKSYEINMEIDYSTDTSFIDTLDYHIEFIGLKPVDKKKDKISKNNYEIKLKITQ